MPATTAPTPLASRGALTFSVVALVLVGLVARGVLLSVAPRYGFLGDHVDYVCWGRQAVAAGVLDLYRNPPGQCPTDAPLDGPVYMVGTRGHDFRAACGPVHLQDGSARIGRDVAAAIGVRAGDAVRIAPLRPAASNEPVPTLEYDPHAREGSD